MAERCSALRIGEPHLQRRHTNTKIEGDSGSGRSFWPRLHLPRVTETRTHAMGSITATTTITTPASVPDLKNVTLLEQSPYLVGLMTILRNAETDSSEFGSCVDRVARLVVASALSHVPTVETQIKTPTGVTYTGRKPAKKVCGVSVLRAGASMESALRECWA
ncbi:hypothetical protein MAP00_008417 [Monascus purpureus]|nr:hypothetical protein MAP00_008417 [Monascus purpureus]